jgi:hypothetical protein
MQGVLVLCGHVDRVEAAHPWRFPDATATPVVTSDGVIYAVSQDGRTHYLTLPIRCTALPERCRVL